ncbi:hypothetical protein JCM33374_g361 [Metschnikowia sp. JCM 33374]|nr:hypothetical protein JCM33374_g361 [Metschnikowia sp. JCM 33374]
MFSSTRAESVKRDLQQVERDLSVHKHVSAALHDLGTLLRDTENRNSPTTKSLIPLVVSFYHKQQFGVLRVLVNFCADSVENRRYLLSDEDSVKKFWDDAVATEIVEVNHDEGVEGEEEQRTLMTLINQFIYSVEEEEKVEFIQKLVDRNVVWWVFAYHQSLRETPDGRQEMLEPMEFLLEYSRYFPELVTRSQFCKITGGYMDSIDPDTDEKDVASFLAHAEFLFNCTCVEDSKENFPVEKISHLFIEVPRDCDERVDILRKLFATCGNIYSFPSYNNWQEMNRKVKDLAGSWSFLMASAAISLGNCVTSKETQAKLIEEINRIEPIDSVAHSLFTHKFEDVVYYQAYHFFNNVITKDIATGLLVKANASAFYHNTKVIVDNFPYYKEVGLLYMKFLRKLVTMGFLEGNADPSLFVPVWEYLLHIDESGEVISLILQAFAKARDPTAKIQISLVNKVLQLGNTVDINTLLQKIKTLSIFLKTYSGGEVREMYGAEEYLQHFVPKVGAFLGQLEEALDQPSSADSGDDDTGNVGNGGNGGNVGNPRASAQSTLQNNSRFLALVVQQNLSPMLELHEAEVKGVCDIAFRMVGTAKK